VNDFGQITNIAQKVSANKNYKAECEMDRTQMTNSLRNYHVCLSLVYPLLFHILLRYRLVFYGYSVRRLRSQETTPIPKLPNTRAPGAGITDGSPI